MRRPVVRLIAARETRDLLRDRRTVVLILVLPLVLYPFFGLAGWLFALSVAEQKSVIGLVGGENLPTGTPAAGDKGPPFPRLVAGDRLAEEVLPDTGEAAVEAGPVVVRPVDGDPAEALRTKKVDALLVVPPGFAADLIAERRPTLTVDARDGDEKSKLAARRLVAAVRKWEGKVREVRLARRGLPTDFAEPIELVDPQSKKPKQKKAADELRDGLVKAFPFILMMWLAAGAIQPAVDLTAGEKERGTMETLLISPAERTEIVAGKFLAVTLFSFGSVLWNVLFLIAGAVAFQAVVGFQVLYLPGLVGCVLLAVPQAMVFSAASLALGVFARSSKEGQYYLMPMLLATMPLAFWASMPGAELTPGMALVPVTGTMLLQQKLLAVTADPVPWEMFVPVLGGLAASVAVALALAVRQFNREAVLFRETGGDKGGPLGKLFGK
jgi:sodium transport system permease protein